LDIQHMKTVKQLYARDMTKTTKLTMRLVTIYIQSINARRVTTKKNITRHFATYTLIDCNNNNNE